MTQYLHPSVDIKVVDNSMVYQTADGTTALFQVIRSEKGPDNTLTRVTTPTEFIYLFGKPNLACHGQAGYNVLNWLKSGGVAYVIRILPNDATYANLSINIGVTRDGFAPLIFKDLQLTSTNGMKSLLKDMQAYDEADALIPLGIVHPYGRGGGYNDIGIRITLRDDLDETYSFRTYDIVVTTKDSLGNNEEIEGPFLVSFDPDAMNNARQSIYWANVLNKYSEHVKVTDNRQAFNLATDFYYMLNKEMLDDEARYASGNQGGGNGGGVVVMPMPEVRTFRLGDEVDGFDDGFEEDFTPFDLRSLDILFNTRPSYIQQQPQEEVARFAVGGSFNGGSFNGGPFNGGPIYNPPGISPPEVSRWIARMLPNSDFRGYSYFPDSVNVFNPGTCGMWEGYNSEESLCVDAYNGFTDADILDPKFVEIDVLLDADYPPSVKAAMASLASDYRGDCLAILDLGMQANEQQSLDFRREFVNQAHRNVAVFAHDMEVFDAHSGANIRVTSPYLLAAKIPRNDLDFGIQYPFVGPRRGIISSFENINFIPNPIWRETFYKAKINYIEQDPRKTNFGTQLTSQAQNSSLSDINNVRVLLRIKREVAAMMSDYRMEFNDTTTYNAASYDLNNYLQKWIGNRACTTATASVFASDYDRQQKIMRVNIELQFTGIIERIAVQITVNR